MNRAEKLGEDRFQEEAARQLTLLEMIKAISDAGGDVGVAKVEGDGHLALVVMAQGRSAEELAEYLAAVGITVDPVFRSKT